MSRSVPEIHSPVAGTLSSQPTNKPCSSLEWETWGLTHRYCGSCQLVWSYIALLGQDKSLLARCQYTGAVGEMATLVCSFSLSVAAVTIFTQDTLCILLGHTATKKPTSLPYQMFVSHGQPTSLSLLLRHTATKKPTSLPYQIFVSHGQLTSLYC